MENYKREKIIFFSKYNLSDTYPKVLRGWLRYSRNDGIYGPNVVLIYSGNNSAHKYIGKQYAADLVYTPNDFPYFRGEFTWFNAGEYLRDVSPGKDILFTALTVQLKF